MNRDLSGWALLGVLGLTSACDAGAGADTSQQMTPTCAGQVLDPNCVLTVSEHDFVRAAVAVTDGTSTARITHTPGSFCLSGTLDPGPTGTGWGALLVLPLNPRDAAGFGVPFDAEALGISQLKFTLEHPPVTGVRPGLDQFTSVSCRDIPECLSSFSPMDAPGRPMTMTTTTTASLPFSSFSQPDWGDPGLMFDPSLLSGVTFAAIALAGAVLDYDFCIRDLEFLDANGARIGAAG